MKANKKVSRPETVKIKIKKIFADHWSAFLPKCTARIPDNMLSSVKEAVEKMLGCGNINIGHRYYLCTHCGKHYKKVGFT